MLGKEFKKDRARTVRDLAEKAKRTIPSSRAGYYLVSRYEDDRPKTLNRLTTIDLQFNSKGTGSER